MISLHLLNKGLISDSKSVLMIVDVENCVTSNSSQCEKGRLASMAAQCLAVARRPNEVS